MLAYERRHGDGATARRAQPRGTAAASGAAGRGRAIAGRSCPPLADAIAARQTAPCCCAPTKGVILAHRLDSTRRSIALRIAMLAPISWRTPPRHYGPWELVTSLLTEALVARGVDVDAVRHAGPLDRGQARRRLPAPLLRRPEHRRQGLGDAPRRPCLRARRRVRPDPQPGRFRAARLLAARRRRRW